MKAHQLFIEPSISMYWHADKETGLARTRLVCAAILPTAVIELHEIGPDVICISATMRGHIRIIGNLHIVEANPLRNAMTKLMIEELKADGIIHLDDKQGSKTAPIRFLPGSAQFHNGRDQWIDMEHMNERRR